MSSAASHQASNRLAREVDATQKRSMGETNRSIFACFARYGVYTGSNFCWSNNSTTLRAIEGFEKRGLAVKQTRDQYGKLVTVWVLPQPLRDRLVELEAEVQAERAARDAEREAEIARKIAEAEARTFTVAQFRKALESAGITGVAAELVVDRLGRIITVTV